MQHAWFQTTSFGRLLFSWLCHPSWETEMAPSVMLMILQVASCINWPMLTTSGWLAYFLRKDIGALTLKADIKVLPASESYQHAVAICRFVIAGFCFGLLLPAGCIESLTCYAQGSYRDPWLMTFILRVAWFPSGERFRFCWNTLATCWAISSVVYTASDVWILWITLSSIEEHWRFVEWVVEGVCELHQNLLQDLAESEELFCFEIPRVFWHSCETGRRKRHNAQCFESSPAR